MTATTARVVATVMLPYLPLSTLGKNGRSHWRTKAADFAALKEDAGWQIWESLCGAMPRYATVTMHIEWYQAGRKTDADNVLARLSAVMDAAEAMHLVADDGDIEIGSIRRIRVAHKAEQRVVIRFENSEAS